MEGHKKYLSKHIMFLLVIPSHSHAQRCWGSLKCLGNVTIHLSYLKNLYSDSNFGCYYFYMSPLPTSTLGMLGFHINSIRNITIGLNVPKTKNFILIPVIFRYLLHATPSYPILRDAVKQYQESHNSSATP